MTTNNNKCQFRVNTDMVLLSGRKKLQDYTDDDFIECGKEAHRSFIMPDLENQEAVTLQLCDEHFQIMMDEAAKHLE